MKGKYQFPISLWKGQFFWLISSWRILWRNPQGALHYFEEDITTWLFWNKSHSFKKKKICQIKLMDCLWVENLGKKGYIPFRKYINLFREPTDPRRINRSAPRVNLAALLKMSSIISEKMQHYFHQLLSPTTHHAGESFSSWTCHFLSKCQPSCLSVKSYSAIREALT